jgi:hypothetical protein
MMRDLRNIFLAVLSMAILSGCGSEQIGTTNPPSPASSASDLKPPILQTSKPEPIYLDEIRAGQNTYRIGYRPQQPEVLIIQTSSGVQELQLPQAAFPVNASPLMLDGGHDAVAVRLHYFEPEATIQNPIDERWAYVVLEETGGKIETLLNTMNAAPNQADNFQIRFDREGHFEIRDRNTSFTVALNIEAVEEYRRFFDRIDGDQQTPQFQPSDWFTLVTLTAAGPKTEIVCVKLIPGIRREAPLGYFQYHYRWMNGEFALTKESFFTAAGVFMENPKIIKEKTFER